MRAADDVLEDDLGLALLDELALELGSVVEREHVRERGQRRDGEEHERREERGAHGGLLCNASPGNTAERSAWFRKPARARAFATCRGGLAKNPSREQPVARGESRDSHLLRPGAGLVEASRRDASDFVVDDGDELLALLEDRAESAPRPLEPAQRDVLRALANRVRRPAEPIDVLASPAVYQILPRT